MSKWIKTRLAALLRTWSNRLDPQAGQRVEATGLGGPGPWKPGK